MDFRRLFQTRIRLFTLICLLCSPLLAGTGHPVQQHWGIQSGTVQSGSTPLDNYTVTLYRAGKRFGAGATPLGHAVTNARGHFSISYPVPRHKHAVLYLVANDAQQAIRLAAMLEPGESRGKVIINERTTVAAAYAMAQFTRGGRQIGGPYPGLQNAAATAQNLANLRSGEVSELLRLPPNGNRTSTLRTFNSLANILAGCLAEADNCDTLLASATTLRGKRAKNTFQAMVNIARGPWINAAALWTLSLESKLYKPRLRDDAEAPRAWTLAVRYIGDGPRGQKMDGPGNIAFDKRGNAWIANNYVYNREPSANSCGSQKLLALTPTGKSLPGAPYGDARDRNDDIGIGAGGLYGAGYGITLDPEGNIWVGSFGFQGTACSQKDALALSTNVAKFSPQGTALSPDFHGFQGRGTYISQPQGTVSDRRGNIWIASCTGNNVVMFPRGNPARARNYDADHIGADILKPFDIAIDHRGHAWVTSNNTGSVLELTPRGKLVGEPVTEGVVHPMGVATDSQGNVWISDSGVMDPPCPTPLPNDMLTEDVGVDGATNFKAAVTLVRNQGRQRQVHTYGKREGTGIRDGLRLPWGIAVDGNDNVFVANFAGQRLMVLCGVQPQHCPVGTRTGGAFGLQEGFPSDALVRNTGVQIDPSGNVWLVNNWIIDAFEDINDPNSHQNNPGGHSVVVYIGLAAPVKTPLLGPVRPAR